MQSDISHGLYQADLWIGQYKAQISAQFYLYWLILIRSTNTPYDYLRIKRSEAGMQIL